jgi:hypothetical protein
VAVEEADDPAARVPGGGVVIAAASHQRPDDTREHAVVVVEEGVSRVRVLPDVVVDAERAERTLQPPRGKVAWRQTALLPQENRSGATAR